MKHEDGFGKNIKKYIDLINSPVVSGNNTKTRKLILNICDNNLKPTIPYISIK